MSHEAAPAGQAAVRRLGVWLDAWSDGPPRRVGALWSQAGAGYAVTFAYEQSYLEDGGALPLSASLPLRADAFSDAEARGFFDNLLPEGERRRTEALAHRLDAADVVGLLGILGAECPGAVSVLPHGAPPVKTPGRFAEDYEPLEDARLAAMIADTAAGRPPGERARFSVAGVQQKLALARHPETRQFLLPLRGAPTTHIVKVEPSSGEYRGIVANEALCLDVVHRLGLPAVHAERTRIGGIPVLVIARYDRWLLPGGSVVRRHQEDAAQVLGVPRELKYEADAERAGFPTERRGYAALFRGFAGVMRAPADARDVLLRAAFANWLLGNCDAHLKNFAAQYGDAAAGMRAGSRLGFGCDLAPLYDVVCVGAFPRVDQSLAMRIGRTETWDEVEREDWLDLARKLFPGRRVPASVLNRQLGRLQDMAAAVLPAVDAAVADGVASREEAKPIRNVAGSRVRHLNRTLGWSIPADTDAPVFQGGGWAMS